MDLELLKDQKSKNKLFWQLQFVFWFAHLIFWMWVDPANTSNLLAFSLQCLHYLAPVLLSFGFRYLIKKYKIHRLPFFLISIIVLFFSLFGGIIWVYEIRIITYFFYGVLNLPQMSYALIQSIWYQSYPFVAWTAIYLGFKFYEEFIIQKQHTEQALLLAKSAQLEMLKYQLNPHFLFNTLSSLRGLINSEPTKAKAMVTHISEILRYSLLEGKNNEVSLNREIEIIQLYLSIEKIRFNEDLVVELDIATESKDLSIPIFLVHPLVENAIKHGMQTSTLPLKVWIKTRYSKQVLSIEVKNSGKWIVNEKKINLENAGTGLQNIQKRLEHAYPGNHSFEISKESGFVQTKIVIDFRKKA